MTVATRHFDSLPADEQALFTRLARARIPPKTPLTPESVLDEFAHLIEECAATYQYGFDDYTNDLTVREVLQDILDKAPTVGLNSLRARVADLDERFRSVTAKLPHPVFAAQLAREAPAKYFFYYRIPRDPGEEFLNDLRRMKLIPESRAGH